MFCVALRQRAVLVDQWGKSPVFDNATSYEKTTRQKYSELYIPSE